MGRIKDYFSRRFGRYSIQRSEHGVQININFQPLGQALDRAQFALDTQVWHDMKQYMPRKDGHLIRQTNVLNQQTAGSGEVHVYDPAVEYAHYIYEGEKYVDPVYRKGGFFSPDYGFWSRKGVAKVPSGEPLFYTNPKAEAHWDDIAIHNHMNDWVEVVRRALK